MTHNNKHQARNEAGNSIEPAHTKNLPPPVPDDVARVWARRAKELAKEPPVEAAGETVKLLVFWLNGERYGIDVFNVREIHPLQQLTPVPRTPNFSAGVFNARGRILSVIDLRAFLGLPASTGHKPDHGKIITVTNTASGVTTDSFEIGLLADDVADVVTLFKDTIEPPLTTHTGLQNEYLQGVTPDLLAVLNLNALLNDKRLIIQEEMV